MWIMGVILMDLDKVYCPYCTECGGEFGVDELPLAPSPHNPEKCRDCDQITLEEWEQLTQEVKELRTELGQYLDYCFRRDAYRQPFGPNAGWWDAGGVCGVEQDGKRLVELGLWERKQDTADSRWWYRPKPQPEK